MGITEKSLNRLSKFNCLDKGIKMCELGAQNIYSNNLYGTIAKDYFNSLGIKHDSFDIVVHQNCEFIDLREPIKEEFVGIYDVVTDFGTTEHVDGNYYQALKNIHDLCKVGGLIVRENPKTGHWPKHGFNYLNIDFYLKLSQLCGYEILDLQEEFAMGNYIDGCNISVVLKKVNNNKFISKEQFFELDYYNA